MDWSPDETDIIMKHFGHIKEHPKKKLVTEAFQTIDELIPLLEARLAALLQQSKEHPKQITKAAKVNFSKWTRFFSICILLVLVFSEILCFFVLCLPHSTEEQCVCWSVLRVAEAKVKNESLKSFSVSLLIL